MSLTYHYYFQLLFFRSINVAPITKKLGAGSTGKSGTGLGNNPSSFGKSSTSYGKSSLGKSSGSSIAPKSINKSSTHTVSKSSSGLSPNKSFLSYIPPKSNKPSVSLGIIWIPTKKKNKKDIVYNAHSHKYDYSDRAPSMYKL